jgi:hypothetical protein
MRGLVLLALVVASATAHAGMPVVTLSDTAAFKKTFADGSTVTLTPAVTDGKLEWKCSSPLPRRMLPAACRN